MKCLNRLCRESLVNETQRFIPLRWQVHAAKLRGNSKCQLLWRNLSNHVFARSYLCVCVCANVSDSMREFITYDTQVRLFFFVLQVESLHVIICHRTIMVFFFGMVWVVVIKMFSQWSVTYLTFKPSHFLKVQVVWPSIVTFGDVQVPVCVSCKYGSIFSLCEVKSVSDLDHVLRAHQESCGCLN